MHAPFNGGDAVREGVDALVVTGVPLEGDLDLLVLLGLLEGTDLAKERLFGVVEMANVVNDAAVVLKGLFRFATLTFVNETNLETAVQKGHDLQTLDNGLRAKLDLFKDRRVGGKRDRRAGSSARRGTRDLELALGLATVFKHELVVVVVAINFEQQLGRKCVHYRDANAVKTSGNLVAPAAELSAGVQHRERDFSRRSTLVLRVLLDGNTAPVVHHSTTAVGEQGDVYSRAKPGHCLVDGVIDDFPDEVVKPGRAGRTDVHSRANSHWL